LERSTANIGGLWEIGANRARNGRRAEDIRVIERRVLCVSLEGKTVVVWRW